MIFLQAKPFDLGGFLDGVLNDDSLISGAIFSSTRAYIYGMVRNFGLDGFGSFQKLLLGVLTVYLTLWFTLQGWRIVTGRTQANMLQFSQKAIMAAFVVWVALLAGSHAANIIDQIENFQSIITQAIAGDEYKNPERMIDGTLVLMQVMGNKLQVYLEHEDSKQMMSTGLLFVTGMGQALPALISGGLLLLNKMALYLCIMFAPLCLAAYLFEATRFMFMAWAKFTVSTLFSLAVITAIVVMAMKAILFVTAALMLAEMTGGVELQSIATAQGGVGMLLTTLVLGGPPLVTNFFSGQVAAAFSGFNQVGGLAQGRAPTNPQEAAAGPQGLAGSGAGANTQQNVTQQDRDINNNQLIGKQYSPQGEATSSNGDIKAAASSKGNAVGAGGYNAATSVNGQGGSAAAGVSAASTNHVAGMQSSGSASGASTSVSASGGVASSSSGAYATANRAEEQALAAQKAQAQAQQSHATTSHSMRTNSVSNTASASQPASASAPSHPGGGDTSAVTADSSSTVSAAERDIRIANTGMGDDSAAIKRKYGNRGLAK